jgi:transketolase
MTLKATSMETNKNRRQFAKKRLLQMHYESKVGHIGCNLSCLDILLSLYHDVMSQDDQFVLSKGHSAGALYTTLWSIGRISDDELATFHGSPTLLSGHPAPYGLEDILFATGSLGHGFGLACGLAHSKSLLNLNGRVFCLTSDGEWNEGSTWEALIYASHRKLSNLTVIVDKNGIQGFGKTSEVANLEPFADRLSTFGVAVVEVNGHDGDALGRALQIVPGNGPLVIVAKTIKGHGVSFMENTVDWHYLPLSEQQYLHAIEEIELR